MRVALSCGHQANVSLALLHFPTHWPCGKELPLYGEYKIIAIECREWKLTCQRCRFGKWCGASESDAKFWQAKHMQKNPTHNVTMDFLVHPILKELIRKQYPRSVKLFITGIVQPDVTTRREFRPTTMVELPDEPGF